MSEWDDFYEEDQKDEYYEPLHFQICRDPNCKFCNEYVKKFREGKK
jgi:hypothetical protein